MPLRPIYYDTETTGVKPDKDRIIEIAAYDAVLDRSFSRLINPQMPIPPDSTAIHNITDEMVKEAPTFQEIGKEFLEFCGSDFILIAHNNDAFDKLFLEYEYKRIGLSTENFLYIDSLKWSRKYRPDLPKHTLQYLRETYGIPANQAHRALDDVIVLHKVFSYLTDDLSMEKVVDLLKRQGSISRMPFGKHQGKSLSEVPKDYVRWLKDTGAFDKPGNMELKKALEDLGLLEKT